MTTVSQRITSKLSFFYTKFGVRMSGCGPVVATSQPSPL